MEKRPRRRLYLEQLEDRVVPSGNNPLPGAIFTSTASGATVNGNIYTAPQDVYLNGGPQNTKGAGLPDGDYYFQVTDPSGQTLLSTDDISHRELVVSGGRVYGVPDPAGTPDAPYNAAKFHATGDLNSSNNSIPVQLFPFSPTPNPGGEYKAWLTPVGAYDAANANNPADNFGFENPEAKTDNFKIRPQITGGLQTFAGADITLGDFATPPSLTDQAVLSGFTNPTGTITFTLYLNGQLVQGFSVSDPVNGNGTYDASYQLPTTGSVTGTYLWVANFTGTANGTPVNITDTDPQNETQTVNPAQPILTTTASETGLNSDGSLGTSPVVLNDSADLEGAYYPGGNLVFNLTLNGNIVYTDTVGVSGNGTYDTSEGSDPGGYTLPTSGAVTGTYIWMVSYSGDPNNNPANDQGGSAEQTVVNPANPSIVTTASATGLNSDGSLGTTPPTLNDSAVLSGGYNETGNLVFNLTYNGNIVYTDTVGVTGNGTYDTSEGNNPGGYTLPTAGTVTGTYTWTVTYAGDGNNNPANDQGGSAEQTVVNPANPTIVTTASATGLQLSNNLGTTPPTLSDSAVIAGGYNETGNLVFKLTYNGNVVYTDTVGVTGNGTYDTSEGNNPGGYTLPTSGTVTGTYTWTVTYAGDGNNTPANDQGGSAEQTVINPVPPGDEIFFTTPSVTSVTLGTGTVTLNDTVTMGGFYYPTGTVTFTLYDPHGTLVYTDTITLTGVSNASSLIFNTATAGNNPGGYTLPTTGVKVTGTYQWDANYVSGDGNNTNTGENDNVNEQVSVTPASPMVITTANPTGTIFAGTSAPTLSDSAALSGGYFETGSITFTLTGPGGFSYTKTVTVNGNGTYTASTNSETALGTYTWTAVYSGDGNNYTAHDQGGTAEQVTISSGVAKNEAATMGFWANKNGQALLSTYGAALGNWLASTYPNLFGNLNGATGSQVASYFTLVKNNAGGLIGNTYAQAMTTALNTWVTTTGLGWNTNSNGPTKYGFQQGFGGVGLGSDFYNVGSYGASFGVPNNTYLTVNQILSYLNSKTFVTKPGSYTTLPVVYFYNPKDTTLTNGANSVLNGINNAGDIV